MKFFFITLLSTTIAFSMGKVWEYERPVNRRSKLKKSSLNVYNQSRERLDINISKKDRDLILIKSRIFQCQEWTDLEKDYFIFRARQLTLSELKRVYPQVNGYKLKRLIEIVKHEF
ncbi:hypothetical protein N9B72_01070 [Bacteriovoracaceae bacterium]|nr:hypothetical protein [Bacteriovoracaceae bacterium]